MSEKQLSVEERNKRTLKKLLIWAVAMFGFAFLMVPFYNVICDITGLNGKTSSTAATIRGSRITNGCSAERTRFSYGAMVKERVWEFLISTALFGGNRCWEYPCWAAMSY